MTGSTQEPVEGIVSLAQARFGELSQAELELLHAAPKGEVAWCGPSDEDRDPANDLAGADNWDSEREIRADLIRWLCVDRAAVGAVDPRGIQVHAAKITGVLDLSFVSVPFPLRFLRCCFAEDTDLHATTLPELDLAGSWVGAVTAEGLVVKGDLYFNNGFKADGEMFLLGAQIGGDIECGNGKFLNPGFDALSADRASVRGSVFLHHGFRAEGTVRLVSTQVGGNLVCTKGTFLNAGKNALAADRVDVKGGVFLNGRFKAEGEVRLYGARIGGELECQDGAFKNPKGRALSADRADIKGSVVLRKDFTVEGEVRFCGARVEGELDCGGGVFKNPGGPALRVERATVGGRVRLTEHFSAEGPVRLIDVHIGSDLDCDECSFREAEDIALCIDHADIKGSVFIMRGFSAIGTVWLTNSTIGGDLVIQEAKLDDLDLRGTEIRRNLAWRLSKPASLHLGNASAASLFDDRESWPDKGKLFLDEFTYRDFKAGSFRDAEKRLEWLDLQDPFRPGPYRQLAKVLREMGDDPGARKVLFEMEHRRSMEETNRWYARLWALILRLTIGYGVYPLRAILALLVLTILGWGLFWWGYAANVMTPTDKEAYASMRQHGSAPDYYPRFTASIYSLENCLPLATLGQKDRWAPDPSPPAARWKPSLLRWFRWVQVLLGWVLATLFVAGVTGLVRKE